METFQEGDSGEKTDVPKKTTLFYRPFDKKEYHGRRERIKKEEDLQKIREEQVEVALEKSLDEEVMKQRFIEIAPRLNGVRVQAEVDVSQERHVLTFDRITKNTKPVVDIGRFTEAVKGGKENLSGVDAHLSLEWTYGREEPLYLDFTVSIGTLLKGGGSLEAELQKLITEQFGGSYTYYRGLMGRQEGKEEPEPVKFEEEKRGVVEDIAAAGLDMAAVESPGLFSIIIAPGDQNKQILVSSVDKQTWNVAVKVDQRIVRDTANLRPQEVLSAIEKEV